MTMAALASQADRQVMAAGPGPVVWFVADQDAAEFISNLFRRSDHGLERIEVEYFPYVGERRRRR
jgi:hypothetical protein